ncbi:Glycoside hydrolase family 5 protein [Mycena sanguinolenta]|uniref:Glycoside hydrolase family 5 protein n=1 Tax=Mycena sanguinolenta TaxID=230812 RepID=A0A8H6ZF05_9AGAR|nr:Glycoside hydrolase family 5 protein [Mycena sanguinolenta]
MQGKLYWGIEVLTGSRSIKFRAIQRCGRLFLFFPTSMSLLRLCRRPGLAMRHRRWSSIARTQDGEGLVIDALGASFPFVWLRDSCLSPECIHPSTAKLHRTSSIPHNIRPAENGVKVTTEGLQINWADGHRSFFPRDFLHRHSSMTRLADFHNDPKETLWDADEISKNPNLFVDYASLQERSGLSVAIDQLCSNGLLFVRGVSNEETADATCELRKLAEIFSYIRETFYGQVWDVVNLRNNRNIAYTNLDLGLHMDLLYFKHPPKYQILHCLRNKVIGGQSLFVDAFHAAATLRSQHPTLFNTLATTPVPFHYINDGHHLHYEHPTIELSPSGEIMQINYSPPFQAPLLLSTPPIFYEALARFAALLEDPGCVYTYLLPEGDAVIFDNRRILHARTAFREKEGEQSGEGRRAQSLAEGMLL